MKKDNVTYLLNENKKLNHKLKRYNALKKNKGKMKEKELETFIEDLASPTLLAELHELEKGSVITPYLEGIVRTLKALGYDKEWVEKEFKEEYLENYNYPDNEKKYKEEQEKWCVVEENENKEKADLSNEIKEATK